MKVLMINGSPHPKGCTYTALKEIADELQRHGIEPEKMGDKPWTNFIR